MSSGDLERGVNRVVVEVVVHVDSRATLRCEASASDGVATPKVPPVWAPLSFVPTPKHNVRRCRAFHASLVHGKGLEPPRLSAAEPKSAASANFATRA